MKQVLYAPVFCAVCGRKSFYALSARETLNNLEQGAPINLRCGFDAHVWTARGDERAVFERLLAENEIVERLQSAIHLPDLGYRSSLQQSLKT